MHFEHILFLEFPIDIGILSYFELCPEQIQKSIIFRTRDILRTLPMYHVKI